MVIPAVMRDAQHQIIPLIHREEEPCSAIKPKPGFIGRMIESYL
jgi:hypothetical protein